MAKALSALRLQHFLMHSDALTPSPLSIHTYICMNMYLYVYIALILVSVLENINKVWTESKKSKTGPGRIVQLPHEVRSCRSSSRCFVNMVRMFRQVYSRLYILFFPKIVWSSSGDASSERSLRQCPARRHTNLNPYPSQKRPVWLRMTVFRGLSRIRRRQQQLTGEEQKNRCLVFLQI